MFPIRRGNILHGLRSSMRNAGLDCRRFPEPGDLEYHLRSLDVDVVIDVGASQGEYGALLRTNGFTGQIISFEPLFSAFAILEYATHLDPMWKVFNCALGETDTEVPIYVAKSSTFSSLLPATDFLRKSASGAEPVTSQITTVRTLSKIWPSLNLDGLRILLKIDTQGSELKVLRGAEALLDRISMIQTEMSLAPLYEGQPPIEELLTFLRERDFVLTDVIRGFGHAASGDLVEVDGIFKRAIAIR